MLMWVLAVVVVGGFAALGFQLGGIRAAVTFLGACLGLALAVALGGLIAPILPKLGVASRTWMLVLPAIVGFAIVWLISLGLSFAAHRPVELHFKYREDDNVRQAFEKMNQAIGLFVGMLTGVVVLFAVGQPIYTHGYLTTQLGSETEPAPLGYLNSLRTGMAQTGWDRTFQPLDKTTPKAMAVSDLLGLVYANPSLTNRIATYPPFLELVERPDVVDVLSDADTMKLWSEQAGLTALLNNPKAQGLISSSELQEALSKIDLADLKKYLETGKSPKYDDEKLLGHWRTDMSAIVTDARRRRANLPLADLKNLRVALNSLLSQAKLTFYPDGRFVLSVPPPTVPSAAELGAPATPAAPAAAPATGRLDPALAARYGLRGQPAAAQPTAAPAVNPADQFKSVAGRVLGDLAKGGKLPDLSSEGTWTRSGDRYTLTFTKNTPPVVREALLQDNGRFVIPVPEGKLTLVFIPAG